MNFDYDAVPKTTQELEYDPKFPPHQPAGKGWGAKVYEQFKCPCGSFDFKVFRTNHYETSVRCCECGKWAVVHDG